MKVKSEREVAQSCPTRSDPMDRSPPGSSVHGIFQARVLEWGAIAFSEKEEEVTLNPNHISFSEVGSKKSGVTVWLPTPRCPLEVAFTLFPKAMEKGTTENKMVGWHHRLNGHEFEQTQGDSKGQGSLACYSPGGQKEPDTTERLNNNYKSR